MQEVEFVGGPLDGTWCDTTQGSAFEWEPAGDESTRPRLVWQGDDNGNEYVSVASSRCPDWTEYRVQISDRRARKPGNGRILIATVQ